MSDYRRYFVAGGTYFFTIVTYRRRPLFRDTSNVQRLRDAISIVKIELPIDINAAVVLPDHMHFLWTLPQGDDRYSKRIGRMKVEFTRLLHGVSQLPHDVSRSRRDRHESDVWQRRFWEHSVEDEHDFDRHFDYIHYNPVKHRLASCPHAWITSTFHHWVAQGVYDQFWGCNCNGRRTPTPDFSDIEDSVGEEL
jgi:putative transposase